MRQVPIGGAYRLIDVPMSNCLYSGLNKIYVLTQFNSASLNRHVTHTYKICNNVAFGDGFVEVWMHSIFSFFFLLNLSVTWVNLDLRLQGLGF